MGDERRLLLLEFVTHERWVYDSRFFPFIKGCGEALGLDARWLCYGSQIVTVKRGKADVIQYMDLDEGELAVLERHVAEQRPTHVVISHSISPAALACLKRGTDDGEVKVLSVSGHRAPEGVQHFSELFLELPDGSLSEAKLGSGKKSGLLGAGTNVTWMQSRTDWMLHWLGEDLESSPLAGQYMVGSVTPSFDAIMCNADARGYAPHLLITGGVACDHFRKVSDNAHYRGIDLTRCAHDYGCAYCTWYRGPNSNLQADPVELAELQLRRVLETAGEEGRYCGTFDMLDIRLFRHVERLFERVLALGVPPSTFCFEPRLDRFAQVADKVERVLPRLAAAGHKIELFRMGAENLVEEENEVFNKFISIEDIDEGTRRLKELAERFPDSFEYDPTFGYITCSPWTTLEMLQTGIDRAIDRGFEPKGVWLYSPLLFYRGAPITVLAEAQGGILADEFDDIAHVYLAACNQISFDSLVPWSFRDERVRVAFSLFVRFTAASLRDKYPDTVFKDDALYALITARDGQPGFFRRPDIFAREVVRMVGETPAPYDQAALMAHALDRYAELAEEMGLGVEPVGGESGESPGQSPPADDPALGARAEKLAYLAGALTERFADRLGDLRVVHIGERQVGGPIGLEVSLGGADYRLRLEDGRETERCFFRSPHFAVSHAAETPVTSSDHQKKLKALVNLLDKALGQYAPELLPG